MSVRLNSREKKLIEIIADALTPPTPSFRLNASDIALGEEVNAVYSLHPWAIRWFFRACLWILEYLSVFRYGRRFSRLSQEEREQLLERWLKSRLYWKQTVVKFATYVILMTKYENDRVRAAIGIPDRRGL
ncbi:MAG: hypothetical protein HY391_02025 [Deltaproteobacteria bacterium]|nr:hypothetical protein [Deltaproteobacteria bacterium]